MVFFPHSAEFVFPTHFAVLVRLTSSSLSCPEWRKLVYQLHKGKNRTGAACVCSKGHGDTIAPLVAIRQYRPLSQLTVRPPYPPDFIPQNPSPTPPPKQKKHPSRTRGENRARKPGAVPVGHGGRPQQEPARGVSGARPQRAQNEKAHCQGARASASGSRTARKHARAARGGGPGESMRVRWMAARREGARARGTGRRAAREHACGPVRRGRGGLSAALAERATGCPRRPPPKLSSSRALGRSRQF